jgi:Tol biopolymer transport system component
LSTRVGLLVALLLATGVGAQAGTPSARIYIDDGSPSWSPDGKRIVFARHRGRIDPKRGECCIPVSAQIHVMDADGGNLRRIPGARFDSNPAWSPNGRLIAFTRRARPFGLDRLYVMRPNGSGARAIRREPFEQLSPTWSPRGDEIAYWRGKTAAKPGGIYALRLDGAGFHRIVAAVDEGGYGGASWSPDGERVLFTRNLQVYVVDADGSDVRRLTRGVPYVTYEPSWSPRGDRIVFRSDLGLYVMRQDGTGIHRITRAPNELSQDGGPAWSPGGGWIVFSGHRGQSDEARIYRVTPAGRGLKRLTTIERG